VNNAPAFASNLITSKDLRIYLEPHQTRKSPNTGPSSSILFPGASCL
jgi:hypothetical protein